MFRPTGTSSTGSKLGENVITSEVQLAMISYADKYERICIYHLKRQGPPLNYLRKTKHFTWIEGTYTGKMPSSENLHPMVLVRAEMSKPPSSGRK
jgi:hypothetical protein